MEIQSNRSCCQEPNVKGSFSASDTRMASISERQSLDMNLITAEGDKVTLSYDAYAAAIYAESTQVEAGEGKLGVQWSEFGAGAYERELSISVEGDLNKQEQREIRKAIRTIGRMLNKFVQGKIKPMMAKAGKLSGLGTIASLDVNMAYERQVVTARQTEATQVYNHKADVLNAPAPPLASEPAPLEEESNALAQRMAEVVRLTQAPRESVLEVTERMLARHRKAATGINRLSADLLDRIRDQFKSLMADEERAQAV